MKNILMNVEMTKAILDGRKSQFRELLPRRFQKDKDDISGESRMGAFEHQVRLFGAESFLQTFSKYQIGEIVRFIEEVKLPVSDVNGSCLFVDAKITDVRVERLQDISDRDIFREGCQEAIFDKTITYIIPQIKNWWIDLWNKTALKGYKWEDNPYVFVYEFERVEG